jgi:4-hydroxy-tetrahydrodipicolinate reductase
MKELLPERNTEKAVKIGLFGYGKMGQTIKRIALDRGHEIVWQIDVDNRDRVTPALLREAEVAIEFSQPAAALHNVRACLEAGVAVVSGTTGWLEQLPEAEAYCRAQGGAMLWSSNFSVGVNLFFALNRYLARLLNTRPEYAPDITEIHHIHKLDAPSGTAVTLAKDLIAAVDARTGWRLLPAPAGPAEVPIRAIREGEAPGTHIVRWQSDIDELAIEHRAHSREGFALGAVLAAEWIRGRSGVFSMAEVLSIHQD